MDWNEVAMFVQVVRAGSFVEAARRMSMPTNTLSRRISKLEASLGTRLLQRSTRKLSLTTSGQVFFERCNTAVTGLDQALEDLCALNTTPHGRVRVAAPADFLTLFGMARVAEFLTLYPQVRLEFDLNDTSVDLIAEGIDVALRGGRLPDSNLVARKLIDKHAAVLVASPAYLARHGTPASFEALAQHQCITGPDRAERVRWRLSGPQGNVEIEVNGPFRANSGLAQVEATLAGLGIALLPTARVAQDLRTGRLIHVLPDYRRDLGGFYAVYPSRQQLPLAVQAFIDFVAAGLSMDLSLTVPLTAQKSRRKSTGRASTAAPTTSQDSAQDSSAISMI